MNMNRPPQPRAEQQRFLDGARAAVHQARRGGVESASPDNVDLDQQTPQFGDGYRKAWNDLLEPALTMAVQQTREALDRAERTINS